MKLSLDELDALDDHIVQAYLAMAEPFPGAKADTDESCVSVRSDLAHPMGNFAMRFRFMDREAAAARLGPLVEETRALGRQARFYLTDHESPRDIERVLADLRLSHSFSMEMMTLRLPRDLSRPKLSSAWVRDPEALRRVTEFWVEEFFRSTEVGVKDQLRMAMETSAAKGLDAERVAIAYLEESGEVVSAGMVFATKGVTGIYNVATRKDHRGKGLATGITVDLLRVAEMAGNPLATLQATYSGRSIYSRLGFRRHGVLRCYVG